jgi:transcriptional regulator with XRE-family HTH domain
MTASARREELKAFLRARRAAIAPETIGVGRSTRRLTPGLRREEVAALAGVGLTWYTWLEQGREINVSADTLRRVARVLRLSVTDEAYLFSLAGLHLPGKSAFDATMPATLQLILDGFTAGPALALGPTMNVLAFNALADQVYSFGELDGPLAHNHLWRAVMDPARRQLYATWEESLRNFIGLFRLHAAPYVEEPEYEQLIATLCAASPDFARIWNERETRPRQPHELPLQHPRLGPLRMHSVRLSIEDFPGLLFLLPPADAATQVAFARALGRGSPSQAQR